MKSRSTGRSINEEQQQPWLAPVLTQQLGRVQAPEDLWNQLHTRKPLRRNLLPLRLAWTAAAALVVMAAAAGGHASLQKDQQERTAQNRSEQRAEAISQTAMTAQSVSAEGLRRRVSMKTGSAAGVHSACHLCHAGADL